MVRAFFGKIGVEAVSHHGRSVGFAVQDGQLRRHEGGRGQLIFAAVGHGHRARADGAVKGFDQALLRADVQIRQQTAEFFAVGCALRRVGVGDVREVRRCDCRFGVLGRAVAVQKFAGEVNNRVAAPCHAHAGFGGDLRDLHRLQIFFLRGGEEFRFILGGDNHSHAFL